MESKKKPFRIGIVMAGAVSAGAYTAGVIDYLLEALQRWEDAKESNRKAEEKAGITWKDVTNSDDKERLKECGYDESLPMHDVVIDVMGGASAGGMTAAIATLGLFKKITPVTHQITKDNPLKEGSNLIYEAWVDLNDDESANTAEQLLSINDLRKHQNRGVPSLLNAEAIWGIGRKAKKSLGIGNGPEEDQVFELSKWKKNLPKYISPELEIILSLCSLRGIPVDVKFESQQEATDEHDKKKEHRMYIHKWNAHFKLWDKEENSESTHTWKFDPSKPDEVSNFLSSAIASGAFPFGLRPIKVEQDPNKVKQKIHLDEEMIKSPPKEFLAGQLNRLFGGNPNVKPRLLGKDGFKSTIVDGGVVNNEPFGEVENVLKEHEKSFRTKVVFERYINEHPEHKNLESFQSFSKGTGLNQNYALLMIDPFPSNNNPREDEVFNYKHPSSVEKLLPPLFSAVRRQAMVKETDIPASFSLNVTRGLIIPKKKKKNGKDNEEFPIACGSLGGFGGFFSKKFREHDFFLGRKNCQSFLRKHFSIDINFISQDQNWPSEFRLFERYADCMVGKNPAMFERFAIINGKESNHNNQENIKNARIRYPIIPDTFVKKARSETNAYRDEREIKLDKLGVDSPTITLAELKELQKPLRKRINAIVNIYLKRLLVPKVRWTWKKSKKVIPLDVKNIMNEAKNRGPDLIKSYTSMAEEYQKVLKENEKDPEINKNIKIVYDLTQKEQEAVAVEITRKNFSKPLWIALGSIWGIILIFLVLYLIFNAFFLALVQISNFGGSYYKALFQQSFMMFLGFMIFVLFLVMVLGFFKSLYSASLTRKVFKTIVNDFNKRGLLEKEN